MNQNTSFEYALRQAQEGTEMAVESFLSGEAKVKAKVIRTPVSKLLPINFVNKARYTLQVKFAQTLF